MVFFVYHIVVVLLVVFVEEEHLVLLHVKGEVEALRRPGVLLLELSDLRASELDKAGR